MGAETAIKLLRNGDCMWEKLKERYNLTDYQIALLRYLLFTFLSESSKLFFIYSYTADIWHCALQHFYFFAVSGARLAVSTAIHMQAVCW